MTSEWRTRPLRDCAKWLSGGTPSTSNPDYWGGDIPWISAASLSEFRIGDSDRRITALGAANGTRLVPPGAILFIVRGMSLKSEFRIGIATREVAFGQDCKALLSAGDIDPLFLAYAIKGRTAEILNFVDEAGHGTGRLQTELLEALPIEVPDRGEQRRIASVLGALDNKIEHNRRISESLDATARTVFHSWFVDFNPTRASTEGQGARLGPQLVHLFPDRLVPSEVGQIPEDWRAGRVRDLCSAIYSGGTPSTQEVSYWHGDLPWLSSGETRATFIIDTDKRITPAGVSNSSTRLAPAYSTVIASAGQGNTRGQTSLLTIDSYVNQSVVVLMADEPASSAYHLFFDLERRYDEFRRVSDAHSSRGSLTTKLLAELRAVLPPPNVIQAFDATVGPVVERAIAAIRESRTLVDLRDALLPKLVSGAIRVPDVYDPDDALGTVAEAAGIAVP
jgi:type I restriction enzyme, S subunit